MKRILLIGVFLGAWACSSATPEAQRVTPPAAFRVVHFEPVELKANGFFGGTVAYYISTVILRHQSGACFVYMDPPGEGGGTLTAADEKVCASHERVER